MEKQQQPAAAEAAAMDIDGEGPGSGATSATPMEKPGGWANSTTKLKQSTDAWIQEKKSQKTDKTLQEIQKILTVEAEPAKMRKEIAEFLFCFFIYNILFEYILYSRFI
jgi:hypothetical protein